MADIRASQSRWPEAAALLREAIPRRPDDDRYVPSKKQLKQLLAEYESHQR